MTRQCLCEWCGRSVCNWSRFDSPLTFELHYPKMCRHMIDNYIFGLIINIFGLIIDIFGLIINIFGGFQATREIGEMNDYEETMKAAIEDKRLLSEELMYCEDLLLTTREQVVAYRAQAKGTTSSPFRLLFG